MCFYCAHPHASQRTEELTDIDVVVRMHRPWARDPIVRMHDDVLYMVY